MGHCAYNRGMKQYTAHIVLAVLLALLGATYWMSHRSAFPVSPAPEVTQEPAPLDLSSGSGITADGKYTVTVVHPSGIPTFPTLNRTIPAASPNLPASARTQILAGLAKVSQSLAANPGRISDWMVLGVYREMLGDYEGARQAWAFVASQAPGEGQAFANLGNLYATYLKDNAKAETNYQLAVKASPANPAFARALAELYTSEGKTAQAEATLKASVVAIPSALDLQVLLAHLYRDAGRTAEAKAAYASVIAAAKALPTPDTGLVSALESELSDLK